MNEDLIKIITTAAEEIDLEFKKASTTGGNTPQDISDRREKSFNKIISNYFPLPKKIWKGSIVDFYGRRSASIDCLIISQKHPNTISSHNKMPSIIFADGVDYAIEIKPNLSDKNEIIRALNQIQSVKKLRRKEVYSTFHDLTSEAKDLYKTIPCCIFGTKTFSDINKLISTIIEYYCENNVPRKEQFDLMIINMRFLIINFAQNSYYKNFYPRGIYYIEDPEKIFPLFLLYLNAVPLCEMNLSNNILSDYLSSIYSDSLQFHQNESANNQLRERNI